MYSKALLGKSAQRKLSIWIIVAGGMLIGAAVYAVITMRPALTRTAAVIQWLRSPNQYPQWSMSAQESCGGAPFLFPTDGLAGYLWDDSFRPGHRHQGIDIFGGNSAGVTPVYAVFDGYLTREVAWKSSVIIRIPDDPLAPGRQIWVYYTHLANRDGSAYIAEVYPPGTYEKPVKAGDLIGYQGNYSGDPANPVGVHLHLSIVRDDGSGRYLNELKIENTIDPSPYLGMDLNANSSANLPPTCQRSE